MILRRAKELRPNDRIFIDVANGVQEILTITTYPDSCDLQLTQEENGVLTIFLRPDDLVEVIIS